MDILKILCWCRYLPGSCKYCTIPIHTLYMYTLLNVEFRVILKHLSFQGTLAALDSREMFSIHHGRRAGIHKPPLLLLILQFAPTLVSGGCMTEGCSCFEGVLDCTPGSLFVPPDMQELTDDQDVVSIQPAGIRQVSRPNEVFFYWFTIEIERQHMRVWLRSNFEIIILAPALHQC